MSYAYEGLATTQKGKIIYRRKKHVFGPKDLDRLIKVIGLPDDLQKRLDFLFAAMNLIDNVSKIPHADVADAANELLSILSVYVNSSEDFEGFGGGTFGGAGATGRWWIPLKWRGKIPEEEE